MIKNIKRVGIIFLAIAIICLMTIGCLVATNVSNGTENLNILNKDSQNGTSITTDYSSVIPEADETINLGTTESEFVTNWGIVYRELNFDPKKVYKVVLNNDIYLEQRTTSSTGFSNANSSIMVPNNARLVFDLNGYTLKSNSIETIFSISNYSKVYIISSGKQGNIIGRDTGIDEFSQGIMIGDDGTLVFNNVRISNIIGAAIVASASDVYMYNSVITCCTLNARIFTGYNKSIVNCKNLYMFDSTIDENTYYYAIDANDISLISATNIYVAGQINIEYNYSHDESGSHNSKMGLTKSINIIGELTNPSAPYGSDSYIDVDGAVGATIALNYTKFNGNTSPSKYFHCQSANMLPIISGNDVTLASKQNNKELWFVINGSSYINKNNIQIQWSKNMKIEASEYDATTGMTKLKLNTNPLTYYDSIILNEVGRYKICIENYEEVITLEILPKEITSSYIRWGTKNFIYNGEVQTPTASYTSDIDVDVIVTGGMTDIGTYKAYATGVSNSNYKLASNISCEYTIFPANLQVDVTTNNVEYDYTGYNAKPSDWYTLSTNGLLGNDSNQSLSRLFTINNNAFIPQFNGNDNAVDIGEYSISTKNIDNVNLAIYGNNNYNVTFNYINSGKLSIVKPSVVRTSIASKYNYLVYENNRRVTYAEKGWIHGVDDNARSANDLVLGNIMPNTSVQSFLNNLVFNDMTALTLKNSKGETIYTNGEIDNKYSALINNGMELAIGTGWTLEYEREVITLSVLGDLTGDGKVNSADVNVARQIVNNKSFESLDNNMKYSMLIINKGNIPNGTDTEILWNVVCGKMDIESFI